MDREIYFKEIIRYVELNSYRLRGRPLAPLGKWRWASLHHLLQPQADWPEGCQTAFRRVLFSLLENPARRAQLGARARAYVEAQGGAAQRSYARIRAALAASGRAPGG